jgi:hypothetical protein
MQRVRFRMHTGHVRLFEFRAAGYGVNRHCAARLTGEN